MNLQYWAQAVKERDDWTCQACGVTADEVGQSNIHADHIKPRALGGKNTLTNGRALCSDCHRERHSAEPMTGRAHMHPQFKELFLQTQLRLVMARKVKMLTLAYVSEATGVPYHRIREYAQGHVKHYKVTHLASLCRFFNCQPADLIILD